MAEVEVFVFLLVAVVALAGPALRANIPYPVVLVLGGLGLALIPGLPAPELEPDVVFFVFLPPLLYSAAFLASAYELRENARPIGLLAIGLVLITIGAIAAVSHWLLGLPWAAAFVLGAVLGPTDPVAATAIIRRLGAPAHIETILEGEALVNDGTGLTAYKIAIAATGAAGLAAGEAAGRFVLVAVAGILVGLAAGWVFARLREAVEDGALDVTLSLLTPFAAYVPAEELGVSGVLAVVTAGLFVGHRSLDITHAATRLRTLSFWDALSFLLNSLLFLLIGLQLPSIVERIEDTSLGTLAAQSLLVAAVAIAVRLAWMFASPAVTGALAARTRITPPRTSRRERLLLGWSGMRGAVSLAAALAIPTSVPERDVIVVITYGVVLVTLVLPSVTLAPLIRALGIGQSTERRRDEAEARVRLAHVALERLEELAQAEPRSERALESLRARYEGLLDRAEAGMGHRGGRPSEDSDHAEHLAAEAVEAQREALRDMRRERAHPADVLRTLERELDLEDSRLHSQR